MPPTTLAEKAGQMMLVGFAGLTAPDYLLDWLRAGRASGVILFARNVQSPQQLAALTAQIQAAAKFPPLISIDQEGGVVARLRRDFAESPGAMALSSIAAGAEAATERASAILGAELRALGLNWNYAPSVDVSYNRDNPTVGVRSFGSDHRRVAALAAAAVRGFQQGGVAASAKHFPGLGDTAIDTHLALAHSHTPLDHLKAVDLLPYRAAIDAGLATIMTTHTVFTALDADYPATLSRQVVQRLIREELGFDGVVTTDCMEMKAIDDHFGPDYAPVLAANAGIDVILYSHTPEKQAAAYDRLLAAAESGEVPLDRIDAANARIAALKARFPAQPPQPAQVNTPAHREAMRAAARDTITLVRQGEAPLPLSGQHTALVEFASPIDSGIQEDGYISDLGRLLRERFPQVRALTLPPRPSGSDGVRAWQHMGSARTLIIAARNAHLIPEQARLIQELTAAANQVVLLCLRNPYDAALLASGAPQRNAPVTTLCTCGDSTPSLAALVEALAGEIAPEGRLPVAV